jgi:hypothetical protein
MNDNGIYFQFTALLDEGEQGRKGAGEIFTFLPCEYTAGNKKVYSNNDFSPLPPCPPAWCSHG